MEGGTGLIAAFFMLFEMTQNLAIFMTIKLAWYGKNGLLWPYYDRNGCKIYGQEYGCVCSHFKWHDTNRT